MTSSQFALAGGVLLVLARFSAAVGRLPWEGGRAALAWLVAVGLLAALVFSTVRTARRLATARLDASQRAVYALGLLALLLVTLALAVPDLLTRH